MSVSLYLEGATPPIDPGGAPADAATPGAPRAPSSPPPSRGTADGTASRDPLAGRTGAPGHKPRGARKPCDPYEEITSLGPQRWQVERALIDWYATHLNELDTQVGVVTHKGADGKPDGARLFLPRCSVLRQVGMRHGDIVHSVNGRRVATLPDAVGAYLVLRTQQDITVEISRKNGDPATFRYHLQR